MKHEPLEPVASARHTWRLVAVLLGIALLGYLALMRTAADGASGQGGSATLYLGLIAAEWGLFAYVRLGLKTKGVRIAELISAEPLSTGRLAADILIGLILVAILVGVGMLFSRLAGPGDTALVQTLLVRRTALIPLWMLLALSAGIVEELTFRGYLQRQFGAWTRSPWLGVVGQAVLFGVTHGYQGGLLMAQVASLGLLFGLAALLRRSLVPGMVAHTGLDIIGGLAALL